MEKGQQEMTPRDHVIEEMAKAAYAHNMSSARSPFAVRPPWPELDVYWKTWWRELVMPALDAMLDALPGVGLTVPLPINPTPDMHIEACVANVKTVWTRMVNVAPHHLRASGLDKFRHSTGGDEHSGGIANSPSLGD